MRIHTCSFTNGEAFVWGWYTHIVARRVQVPMLGTELVLRRWSKHGNFLLSGIGQSRIIFAFQYSTHLPTCKLWLGWRDFIMRYKTVSLLLNGEISCRIALYKVETSACVPFYSLFFFSHSPTSLPINQLGSPNTLSFALHVGPNC